MYDAILLASEDLMSKQKGRKALILLTDGVDTGSKVTLFQAISAAQKADTLVYRISAKNRSTLQARHCGLPLARISHHVSVWQYAHVSGR